jgi:hypothetical protein
LNPIPHPPGNILEKGVCSGSITIPAPEGGDEFGIGIYGAECPNAAHFGRIIDFHVLLFLADESPNFIHLQASATQVAHLLIHQGGATLSDLHAKPHDCVAVDARHTLDRADAGTLSQCADYSNLFIGVEDVCHDFS